MRRVPKLKFVKSAGQYRCRWEKYGKVFYEYFGNDEAEAEARYAAWKLEWIQASVAGKVRQATAVTGFDVAAGLSPDITDELTLGELGRRYLEEMQREHTKNEAKNKRLVVDHVLKHVGEIYWSEFGTAAYKRLQKGLVVEGRTRKRINKICGEVRAWMKWCYHEELISRKLHQDFLEIGPVRKEKRGSKKKYGVRVVEAAKIRAVLWPEVVPILPYLSPVVAAMVTVQYWGGMRPGEVCKITLGELDMTDDECWFYEPFENKMDRFIDDDDEQSEYDLFKGFGKTAQDALRPFVDLCKDPSDYVFRPIHAMQWRGYLREKTCLKENRKTPQFPSEVKQREKRKRERRLAWEKNVNPCYETRSYGSCVAAAFRKAKREGETFKSWSPGQLRHGIATQLRAEGRLQDATALLGHKSISMTTNYAELTKNELRRVVRDLEAVNAA